jgi:hypothetical protein
MLGDNVNAECMPLSNFRRYFLASHYRGGASRLEEFDDANTI